MKTANRPLRTIRSSTAWWCTGISSTSRKPVRRAPPETRPCRPGSAPRPACSRVSSSPARSSASRASGSFRILFDAFPGYDQAVFGPTLALFIAWTFINIHHYFIDNVTWRRENPETRRHLFGGGAR